MKFDDLHPHIVPLVPEIPAPLIEQKIREAAQVFFARTHAWEAAFDPIAAVDGATEYELSAITGAQIEKVLSVEADEAQYAAAVEVGADGVLRFLTSDLPKAGAPIAVKVALRPAVGSPGATWSLPASLDRYAPEIALGAVSLLLQSIPERRAEAMTFAARFQDAINTVGIQVSRGRSGRRLTRASSAQFF